MAAGSHQESWPTEGRNERTLAIDAVDTLEILGMLNREDLGVAVAVHRELPAIARAVELAVACLSSGGRLFYVGAGTSGRLGVIDAAECGPTFGVGPETVQAIMAGGQAALTAAIEGIEDDADRGATDVRKSGVGPADAVVGISASGHTPYTVGALREAKGLDARTIAICNNPDAPLAGMAEIGICPATGPEAIMGSTRLKAGTAQKMVLNMLSTATMIRLGKVYSNLMVDVRPANAKLLQRAKSIVALASGCSEEEAVRCLEGARSDVKVAVVMALTGLMAPQASALLEQSGGHVRAAARMSR
ncbi:MAG TPA: N-acetylmuramic acid 6-phosphate etherase [Clostridiales bacterium UBA8153]|nr:N-acetylmuramic acid 6-phosphate etherase [Clostridiales bacterium UBA8153]